MMKNIKQWFIQHKIILVLVGGLALIVGVAQLMIGENDTKINNTTVETLDLHLQEYCFEFDWNDYDEDLRRACDAHAASEKSQFPSYCEEAEQNQYRSVSIVWYNTRACGPDLIIPKYAIHPESGEKYGVHYISDQDQMFNLNSYSSHVPPIKKLVLPDGLLRI